MASLNKAILIGRVGKDPDTRYTAGGTCVSSFSLATSEYWKDKNGERKEKTEWHNCEAWGKLGEIVEQYVSKGSLLYVEGRIGTQTWEKNGQKHSKTVITVASIQMLSKSENGGKKETRQEQHDPGDDGFDEGGFIGEEDVPL